MKKTGNPSLIKKRYEIWLLMGALVVGVSLLAFDEGGGAETSVGHGNRSLVAAIEQPAWTEPLPLDVNEKEPILVAQASPEEKVESPKEEVEPSKEGVEPPKEEVDPSKEGVEPSKEGVEPSKEEVEPPEEEVEPPKEEVELPPLPPVEEAQDIPPVALPPVGTERCQKAMGVYKARLRARERTLAASRAAMEDEKFRVESIQEEVEARWAKAKEEWEVAEALVAVSNRACSSDPANASDLGGIDLGLQRLEPEARVNQVVAIIKSMKPAVAAKVIERWNHPLATTALRRLSPRIASKILAEMPEEMATKLTVDMLKGKELPKRRQ